MNPNTAKLRLEVVLEYETDLWHGDDTNAKEWFFTMLKGEEGELLLHNNDIDTIGTITVTRILNEP